MELSYPIDGLDFAPLPIYDLVNQNRRLRDTMKRLWIGAIAATLSVFSGTADAFEVQGATVVLPDGASPFGELGIVTPRPGGTLNLLRDDADSPGLPQYGNSIAIPGPGVDAPAWTYSSPYFRR
jgi:hypothetical protein